MPRYTVKNSQTNQTVTFDWNDSKPPTDSDMEEVFAEVAKVHAPLVPLSSLKTEPVVAATTATLPYSLKPTEDPLLNRLVSGVIKPVTKNIERGAAGLERVLEATGVLEQGAPRAKDVTEQPSLPVAPFSGVKSETAREIGLGAADVVSGVLGATMGAIPMVAKVNTVVSAISPYVQEIGQSIGGEAGQVVADKLLQYGAALKFGTPVLAGSILSDITGVLSEVGLDYTTLSKEAKDKITELSKTVSFFVGAGAASIGLNKFAERGVNAIPEIARQPSGVDVSKDVAELERFQSGKPPEKVGQEIPILKGADVGVPKSLIADEFGNPIPAPEVRQARAPFQLEMDEKVVRERVKGEESEKEVPEGSRVGFAQEAENFPFEGAQAKQEGELPLIQKPEGVVGTGAREKLQIKEELNRAIDEEMKTGQPVGTSASTGESVVNTPTDRLLRAMSYPNDLINSYTPKEKNDIISMSISKSPADFARDAVKIGEQPDGKGGIIDLYNIENPAYGEKINGATIAVKPNENLADRVMQTISKFQGTGGTPILSLGGGLVMRGLLPEPATDEEKANEPLWKKLLRTGADVATATGLLGALGLSVAKRKMAAEVLKKVAKTVEKDVVAGIKDKSVAIDEIPTVVKSLFGQNLETSGLLKKLGKADVEKLMGDFVKGVENKFVQNEVPLVHYSKVSSDKGITLSKTDPNFMGKGAAGEEQSRAVGRPKVTYFYPEGTKEEVLIRQWEKYHGVGNGIYPANADILDLQSKANGDPNKFERLVKSAGYDGVRFDRDDGRSQVFMFNPVDVFPDKILTAAYKLDDGSIIRLGNVHTIPKGLDVNRIVDAGFAQGDKFLTSEQAAKIQNKPDKPFPTAALTFGLGTAAQVAINNSDLDEETKKRYSALALGFTLAGAAVLSSRALSFIGDIKSSALKKVMTGKIEPSALEGEVAKQISDAKLSDEWKSLTPEEQKQISESIKSKEQTDATKEITSNKEFADNIRLGRFEEPAKKPVEDLVGAEQQSTIDQQKRGVRSREVTNEAAAKEGSVVEKAKAGKIEAGTAFNAEELTALDSELNRLGKLGADGAINEYGSVELSNFLKTVHGAHAEAGRSLQALSGVVDPSVAETIMKVSERSNDPAFKKIVEETIQRLKKRESIPPGLWDKIAEFGRNVKLASLSAVVRSTVGNSVMSLLKFPELYTAGKVDAALSAITGRPRERYSQEAAADLIGSVSGIKDGFRGAWNIITEKNSELQQNIFLKQETGHSGRAIGGTAGYWITMPQKVQGAVDAAFRMPAAKGAIARFATRKALQEGLTNEAFFERVDQLIKEPTPDIIANAATDSRYRTFQQDLGSVGKAVNRLRMAHPSIQILLPFYSTPTNLFKSLVEHSPLAPLAPSFQQAMFEAFGVRGKAMARGYERITEKPYEMQQGEFADKMSRALVGVTFTAGLGVVLTSVMNGNISGRGDPNRQKKDALMRTGWQPYSVRIGDTWISYRGYEPMSGMLSLLADVQQGAKEEGIYSATKNSMINVARNFMQNPFLTGINDMFDAFSSDEGGRFDKFISGMAVGMIAPTIAAQTKNILDPTVKKANGIWENIESRIPVLSENVLPKRNVFGEKIEMEKPALRMLAVNVTTQKNDPLETELQRLGLPLSNPSGTYEGMKLTPVQLDKLTEVAGKSFRKVLDKMIVSSSWSQLTDGMKISAIKSTQDLIREAQKNTILMDVKLQGLIQKADKNLTGGVISLEEKERTLRALRKAVGQ